MPLEERRGLLLRTAASLFSGPDGDAISLDAIAAAAGVAKPAIYELFDSKQSLFEAAVAAELEQLVAYMSAAHDTPQDRNVVERTRIRVEAVFGYVREHPASMRLLLSASHHPTPVIAGLQAAAREAVTGSLARAISPELSSAGLEADEGGVLLVSTMSVESAVAAALLSLEHPDWDLDAVTRLVTSFLLGGFGGLDAVAVAAQQP